jgi:lysozyme
MQKPFEAAMIPISKLKRAARMIEGHEGFRASVYIDSVGKHTIGYGINLDRPAPRRDPEQARIFNEAKNRGRISEPDAAAFVEIACRLIDTRLSTALPWWHDATETTQVILIDMCYNLGFFKFFKFKNTLKKIGLKKYKEAAMSMSKSLWYRQVGRRSIYLCKLMSDQTDDV